MPPSNNVPKPADTLVAVATGIGVSAIKAALLVRFTRRLGRQSTRIFGTPPLPDISTRDAFALAWTLRAIIGALKVEEVTPQRIADERVARENEALTRLVVGAAKARR